MNQFSFLMKLTDFADGLAVRQIVRDNLSQLREVPPVPLSAAHDVIVELLVQVIQKRWKMETIEGH